MQVRAGRPTRSSGQAGLGAAVVLALLGHCAAVHAQPSKAPSSCREVLEEAALSDDRSVDAAELRLKSVPPQCKGTMRLLLQARLCLLRSDWQGAETLLGQHDREFSPVASEGDRSGQIETTLRRTLIDWKDRLRQERYNKALIDVRAAESLIAQKPHQAMDLLREAEKNFPVARIYLYRAIIGLGQNQLRQVDEALSAYRTQGVQAAAASAEDQQQYESLNQALAAAKDKERQKFRNTVAELAQPATLQEEEKFKEALRIFDRAYEQLYWMTAEILHERVRFYGLVNRPLDGLNDLQRRYADEAKNRPELSEELRRRISRLRLTVPDDKAARCILSGKAVQVGTDLELNPGIYVAEIQGRESPIVRLSIELKPGQNTSFPVYLRAFTQHLEAAAQLRVQGKWKLAASEYLKTVTDTLPTVARATALAMLPDMLILLAQAYENAQMPTEGMELLLQYPTIPGAAEIRGRLESQLVTLKARSSKMAQLQIDEQTVSPIDTAAGRVWEWAGNPGEHTLSAEEGSITLQGKCGFRNGQRLTMTLRFPETDHPSPLLAIKDNKFLLGPGRYINLALGLSAVAVGGILIGLDGRQDCQYGQCARALDTKSAGIATLVSGTVPLGLAIFGLAAKSYLQRTQNERVRDISCP